MMVMSMWYVILVPFFILMVVVGTSRRNNHDSDEETKVDNTDQGEEEGITHLCGSMSQGLGEVKGVEPQNLHVTIVIQNTEVPIPV
jgi:hypothetical protein